MIGRDPRSDSGVAPAGNPQVGGGLSGSSIGGYKEAAIVDLGNGTGALVTLAAVRTKTTPAASSTSTQLLAADVSRLAVTILNTDTTKTLYIGLNGVAAVAGTNPVPPLSVYNVPVKYVAAQVNGIWDAGATGPANVLATTA